jgi:hypothetical protein
VCLNNDVLVKFGLGGALFSNEPIKVAVILLGVTVRTSSYLEISNSDMIKENFSSASFG